MSQTQRIIKYFAVGLACLLIFSIISGIFHGIILIDNLFGTEGKLNTNEKIVEISQEDIKRLDVELKGTRFIIEPSDDNKISVSESEYISSKTRNGVLYIKEKSRGLFEKRNETIILSVPKDFKFDSVEISHGAGELKINSLITDDLELELGAGSIEINNLVVFKEADIEGGAGAIKLKDVDIEELNLDMGVGNLDLSGSLGKKSEINAGVGTLNILLNSSSEDYLISVDKGLGKVTVAGKKVNDGDIIGNGKNKLFVNGGIGDIAIDFYTQNSLSGSDI